MWGYNLFYDGTQITNRDESDCEFETKRECYEDAEYEIDETIKYWESEGSWRPENGDSREYFSVETFEGDGYQMWDDSDWDDDDDVEACNNPIHASLQDTMDGLNDVATFSDLGSSSLQSALRSLLSSLHNAVKESSELTYEFARDPGLSKVDMAHVKSYLWAAYNTLAKYVPSEDE